MTKMKKINLALQVLPKSKEKDSYALVDEAIKIIDQSGVRYRVTPFETVMEGEYDKLMKIIKEVQDACFKEGADELMVYIKMQIRKDRDVEIRDKMEKYD